MPGIPDPTKTVTTRRQRATQSVRHGSPLPCRGKVLIGRAKEEVRSLYFVNIRSNAHSAIEPDDASRQVTRQQCGDAEHGADKARIQALEERVQVLEDALQRYTRVDVGLGYLDDQQEAAERRIEELERFHEVARERLAEWEDRWAHLRPSTSTTPAPPAYPAPPPPAIEAPLPVVVVIPATPQSSQGHVGAPSAQGPPSSLPLPAPVESIPPREDRTINVLGTSGQEEITPVKQRSPALEDSTAPQPVEIAEGPPAPDPGNAEVAGGDAEMAAPIADDRMPPSPPWRKSPLPSTNLLAAPVSEDPQPMSPCRSRSRSPAPPPSRRSPRLQTPAPPVAEDGEVLMEVDK